MLSCTNKSQGVQWCPGVLGGCIWALEELLVFIEWGRSPLGFHECFTSSLIAPHQPQGSQRENKHYRINKHLGSRTLHRADDLLLGDYERWATQESQPAPLLSGSLTDRSSPRHKGAAGSHIEFGLELGSQSLFLHRLEHSRHKDICSASSAVSLELWLQFRNPALNFLWHMLRDPEGFLHRSQIPPGSS